MIIYTDSREQKPLTFVSSLVKNNVTVTLPYGDYACTIKGDKCPIVFERKAFGDLFKTLTTDHERFKREINKSIADGYKLVIIIEKPVSTIAKGYKYSKTKGLVILRQLFTLMLKHQIPFVACTNRAEMSLYITECFNSWGKLQ